MSLRKLRRSLRKKVIGQPIALCLLALLVVLSQKLLPKNGDRLLESCPPPTPVSDLQGQDISNAPPVPCLGTVVGADPNLFLLRFFYSLDHPVERLVIAYGGNDSAVSAQLNHISNSAQNLTVDYLGEWPGVAQGWNRIIEKCGDAAWYLIANMDVEFEAGSLAALSKEFTADVLAGTADFGGPVCVNIGDGTGGCGFTVFAMSQKMRDTAGLFDENIYPAYYEDSDYWRRVVASQLPSKAYEKSRVWHSWRHKSQSSSAYLTKSTSAITFKAIQRASQQFTIPYLKDKWGCTNQTDAFEFANCTYSTPWNNGSLTSWVPPSEAQQREKLAFLQSESANE